jgi:exopolysaccharide biosynthesis polyprenyl glycosylphosphotransferase
MVVGVVVGVGGAQRHADATLGSRARPLGSARLIEHLAYSTSELLAIFAVLGAERRLTLLWVLWAVGLLAALTGMDRRAAAQITPRLADAVLPLAARVGATLLLVVPFDPFRSAADLAGLGVVLLLALLAGRGLVDAAVRGAHRRDRLHHRVLIVGSGEIAARLVRAMLEHPAYGMWPIGLVDDDAGGATVSVPRLGSLADLTAVATRERVTRIVLAFSSTREALMVGLLRACERLSVEIYAVPRLFELGFDSRTPNELWGIPLAHVPRALSGRSAQLVKRGFDVLVSLAALLLLSPVLAIIAAAIRLSGPGPVTFHQCRLGLNGRPFMLMKFRTLPLNDDGDRTWSVVHDSRVGKLGRFLRHTGLDEAPQLFNVLRGDMSLVGPRPERPAFADIFTSSIVEYAARHRVRPGITGRAQVHGLRGDTSIADRVRFDNYYVAMWTLSGDIIILLSTAGLFLRQIVIGALHTAARARRPASAAIAGLATGAILEQPTPTLVPPGTVASQSAMPESAQ